MQEIKKSHFLHPIQDLKEKLKENREQYDKRNKLKISSEFPLPQEKFQISLLFSSFPIRTSLRYENIQYGLI